MQKIFHETLIIFNVVIKIVIIAENCKRWRLEIAWKLCVPPPALRDAMQAVVYIILNQFTRRCFVFYFILLLSKLLNKLLISFF